MVRPTRKNYERININYETEFRIKEIKQLLMIVKNPIIIKILESDLLSWLAIKRLIDEGNKK